MRDERMGWARGYLMPEQARTSGRVWPRGTKRLLCRALHDVWLGKGSRADRRHPPASSWQP